MAPTFLQLAIPQLAESGRSTLRKCCACHEICTRPRESAAPATKSILDLAKVLHLPRNSNLAKPSRGRANGPVSETVPRPFRDRSETVPGPFRDRLRTGVATEVVCALSGSPIHAWHQRFCNLLSPSSPDFSFSRSFFRAHPCILKLSICQAGYMSKLSICHARLWKAIYVLSWLYVKAIYLSCWPIGKLSICQASYMSKLSICHASYLS